MNESPNCLVCQRPLWDDETGQYACRLCERRIDDHLRSLAGPRGLYARLCLRNEAAGPGTGPRITGSAAAGIAGNLGVLNDTANGGIVSLLEGWVADWSTYGLGIQGTGGRLQYRVDQAVATLRRNLPQAVRRHPALDSFADEIYLTRRQCERYIDGQPLATFKVTCPCERVIHIPVDAPHITCPGCRTSYGYEQVRQMAVEQKAAA
ncbi:hypothetical protein ACWENO_13930 [Streptomyces sp. NPDC004436]